MPGPHADCEELRAAYDAAVAEHGKDSDEAHDAWTQLILAGCETNSGGTSPPPHG